MINDLVEDMAAIRDANQILIDVVCDPDMSIQGMMILDRVQIVLLKRQFEVLRKLNHSVKRHELRLVRGMVQ